MLGLLLPEAGDVGKAIAESLRGARRQRLPEDPWELLRFVKSDVGPALKKRGVPANLVVALVDDLAEEIDHRPREGEREGPATVRRPPPEALREAAARSVRRSERPARRPSVMRPPPVKADAAARTTTRAPTRKARSVAPPRSLKPPRTARTSRAPTVAAALREPSAPPAPEATGPIAVVVDSDGLARAALARELVKARLEVSAFATLAEVGAALRAPCDRLVLIAGARQIDIESIESLVEAHPALRVVITADTATRSARSMLTAAGVAAFSILPKAASIAEIVAATRKFLASEPPPRPVAATAPPSAGNGPRSRR
jgi:hypothetical protein